jgi:hypothetical protein
MIRKEELFLAAMGIFILMISCKSVGVDSDDNGTLYDKPTAVNTGYSGTLMNYNGDNHITVAGTVLENFSFSETIYIEANDVVIRNFKMDATGEIYGFVIDSGCSGVLLVSGEISNMSSAAILGTGFTAQKLNIHDSGGDGIKPHGLNGYPVLVEACFIHHLGWADDAHADGCQIQGGRNITFRYNTIDMPDETSANWPGHPYKASGVFELQYEVINFVIEYNWLNGGGYTIRRDKYAPSPAGDYFSSGVYVRNNKFGRDFDFSVSSGTYEEWIGNTWEDTGEIVTVGDNE